MKIRTGFVSNSSSSSFVINKYWLSQDQVQKICNHTSIGEEMGMSNTDWSWSITDNEKTIEGSTYMDNFDMREFLENIGVKMNKVKWNSY